MNFNSKIIELARSFKSTWGTSDPYEIARRLGITVLHRRTAIANFTAQTLKLPGYPTVISINDAYTDFSKKLLCAHELGHAILHSDGVNNFATTSQNIHTNVEQEANLFAIALLTDKSFDSQLTIPLADMSNYLLKELINYNLKKSE